jgi:hypothetical protein
MMSAMMPRQASKSDLLWQRFMGQTTRLMTDRMLGLQIYSAMPLFLEMHWKTCFVD